MNRLECIKSMVSKCNTAADIGTDHGYIAEMLLHDNTAKKVIASDINKGPLNRAIKYLTSKNLNCYCDFRLGSGLKVLNKEEAEAIIIAGMGGELISNILEESKDISSSTYQLILQPMTAVDKLRRYLYNNNFKIIDEDIVKEQQHYYFIIKAEPGFSIIEDEIYYEFSKILIGNNNQIMKNYIIKVLQTNNKIIRNLELTNNSSYKEKINILKNKNNKIMELINNETKFNS
ncbi:tRNA (adenine(22)-N(1))-methyltransferase [Sedimentibacter sp. MB31-C6]|uniref:tRNA (adenine(22)-N(1))-methyltransferase n=1 Tax=Sedimentibacter sp. MB31-C6 TaxID=3109366 RepID=UPI002DDD39FD|nr:class I SAM-dependent methyltransferase [Sedimentibacter sp. MB36-C1]WSI04175.1 class I SAM-dependent methyltransferase [Sedimentibacter sp. MB36-C1]